MRGIKHDSVPAYELRLVQGYLLEKNTDTFPHPSYSPDLTPCKKKSPTPSQKVFHRVLTPHEVCLWNWLWVFLTVFKIGCPRTVFKFSAPKTHPLSPAVWIFPGPEHTSGKNAY